MKIFKKRPETEEISSLRGRVTALEEHIKWLETHVERHANSREKAEDRLEVLHKLYLELAGRLNK